MSRNNDIYEIEEVATAKRFTRHVESSKAFHNRENTANSNIGLISLLGIILLTSFTLNVEATLVREPSVMWQWTDKTVFGHVEFYDIVYIYK